MKLVHDIEIPDLFEDSAGSEILNLSIKYDSGETTDIIMEDVVVEYKTHAGKEQTFRGFKKIFLKTYVSVGITSERYSWIYKTM
jgi:hypothetical protein